MVKISQPNEKRCGDSKTFSILAATLNTDIYQCNQPANCSQ